MKATMTAHIPSAATVHFITKILASGGVSVTDVGSTINRIDSTLRNLHMAPPIRPVAPATPAEPPVAEHPPAVASAPMAAEPPVKRGRGRPPGKAVRRPVETAPDAEAAAPPQMAAQPSLLRRSHAALSEEALVAQITAKLKPAATPADKLRGVVKWYDTRTGKGALRLVGIAGDITLDASLMAEAGIKRLYKDQEIEATIRRDNGTPALVALSLPGRAGAQTATLGAGEAMNIVRRHARTVTIEIKQDAAKQRRARARAERMFGDGPAKSAG